MALLQFFCVVFFAAFLANINKGYKSTFFSTLTGKQFVCQRFREAASDKAKIDVFANNESYYEDIRAEVKEWVAENWTKWNYEKPEWFSSRVIIGITKEMIPKEEEMTKIGKQNKASMRSGPVQHNSAVQAVEFLTSES